VSSIVRLDGPLSWRGTYHRGECAAGDSGSGARTSL